MIHFYLFRFLGRFFLRRLRQLNFLFFFKFEELILALTILILGRLILLDEFLLFFRVLEFAYLFVKPFEHLQLTPYITEIFTKSSNILHFVQIQQTFQVLLLLLPLDDVV